MSDFRGSFTHRDRVRKRRGRHASERPTVEHDGLDRHRTSCTRRGDRETGSTGVSDFRGSFSHRDRVRKRRGRHASDSPTGESDGLDHDSPRRREDRQLGVTAVSDFRGIFTHRDRVRKGRGRHATERPGTQGGRAVG